jgi:phenylacetate-CoA ligase
MCAVSPEAANVDYVATGGSSGEPLRFYFAPGRSAVEYAYLVASWERAGFRLGEPMAVLRGQVVAPGRDGLRHEYDALLRRHYFSNFHMSDGSICRYLERIATLGPRVFLLVYPSSVVALARHALRSGTPLPGNIAGMFAGSETVYPDERSEVERAFGRRFFSWYGHSEKLVLAAECEGSSDYHVWPTYGFMELLDAEGCRVTTPGRRGEIVGTGFMNTVVPFIRYRTGDFAEYVGEGCGACGRQHTILRSVEGRWSQGALVAHDGSLVSMTAFNVHDDTFENVKGYQFRQTKPGSAHLRIVPARALSEAERAYIIKGASARLQGQVSLTLEMCEELERTPAGKQLRVVQSIPLGSGVAPASVGRR